jgi:hypothetical protein
MRLVGAAAYGLWRTARRLRHPLRLRMLARRRGTLLRSQAAREREEQRRRRKRWIVVGGLGVVVLAFATVSSFAFVLPPRPDFDLSLDGGGSGTGMTGDLAGSVAGSRSADGPHGPIQVADVKTTTGSKITVNAAIAGQVQAMVDAAGRAGIVLAGSGYRSHQRQIELRTINGCPNVWSAPPSSCRTPTAIPGTSRHESGLAIDFSCSGKLIGSHDNKCFRWLAANASRYGLYNLPSEAWHWSDNGR